MKWIDYTSEHPPTSGYYFVRGKKETSKAVLWWCAYDKEWTIDYLPVNHFADECIMWLKE